VLQAPVKLVLRHVPGQTAPGYQGTQRQTQHQPIAQVSLTCMPQEIISSSTYDRCYYNNKCTFI